MGQKHGRAGERSGKDFGKKGMDACSNYKARVSTECQIHLGMVRPKSILHNSMAETSSRNSGLQPSTEKLPKDNGKQLCAEEQRPLKYQIVVYLAPKCRKETEFCVTTEFWQATNKTYFGEAGMVSIVYTQNLHKIICSNKVRVTSKIDSVVRSRKGGSHSSGGLRQMIQVAQGFFKSHFQQIPTRRKY